MDELSVFIETHGCQMNEYDSDRILNSLSAVPAKDPSNADIIIVNTCAIREKANHKAVSAVGKYKNLKKLTYQGIVNDVLQCAYDIKENESNIGFGGCFSCENTSHKTP